MCGDHVVTPFGWTGRVVAQHGPYSWVWRTPMRDGTSLNPGDDDDRREIGPVDTEALRASFVQAQAQIMNNGEYTPVVVIDKGLALGLLDEIERQRRLFAALAQVNGWRDGWMSRAAAEMHTVLDAHQDGEPTPASTVQCMEALIAEWWDEDGEDGAE